MKLRFAVDQGECLRRGVDCKSSTITIEVDPPKLPQEERDLIANRMRPGKIDVYWLIAQPGGNTILSCNTGVESDLICANSPDYAGLIEAVRENEEEVKQGTPAEKFELSMRETRKSFQPPDARSAD